MFVASLLVSLNVIFVVSGAANAVYGKLPGMHSAGATPKTLEHHGGIDVVTGPGECGYGGSRQQGFPLRVPVPVYVGTSHTFVKAC